MLHRMFRCGIGLSLLTVGFLIAGCSQEGAEPVTGTFVGAIPDVDAYVAVVATDQGEGGDQREVRAYLCDGINAEINEWFRGPADRKSFDLSSEGAARLEGDLAEYTATGTITLPDGRSLSFEATPPAGVAGLYDVSILADGSVFGVSEGGNRIQGSIADEPEQNGLYPITGTITAADGELLGEYTSYSPGPASGEVIESRAIFLENGSMRGARKGDVSRPFSADVWGGGTPD